MVFQGVGRVVGGADDGDAVGGEDAVGGQGWGGEARVGFRPDARRVGLVDQQVDAEVTAQLQVRPVVERIADQRGDGAREGEELVVVAGGVAGDEVLRHARGAQGAPLVVVAAEPDLREVGELPVGRDLVGREVAVVIEDRLLRRVLEVETPGPRIGQEEVVGQERLGERHGG